MSDYQQPISEYIKQGFFIIIVAAIALFGIKTCRKYQKKRQVVIELNSHANESAAYEQFYTETAHENLLKAMYQMHLGTELGLTANEIIDKVMQSEDGFLSSNKETNIPLRQELIRDALLSNFDNCKKLGLFNTPSNINSLSKGELPIITKGPATDETAIIRPIIVESILPGADKLMPNMIISPPTTEDIGKSESHLQRARAKLLLKSLAEASLIGREAYRKVLEHYQSSAVKQ